MHIEFTYRRSRQYFRRQLVSGASQATQVPRTIAQVLLFGAVAVPVVLRGSRLGIEIGVILLLAGGPLLAATLYARHRIVTVPESWLGERHWRLTDDRLEWTSAHSSVRTSWSQLRLTRVLPGAYLLRGVDGMLNDIPREPLSPADDAQLRAFLDRLPAGGEVPLTPEPLPAGRTRIEFTSSQSVRPVGARLAALRRRLLWRAVLGRVAVALMLFAAGLVAGGAFHYPYAVVLGAIPAVGVLIAMVRLWFATRRPPREPTGTPRRFTITDQALQADGASRSVRWDWALVKRLREWPETYLLYQDGGFPSRSRATP